MICNNLYKNVKFKHKWDIIYVVSCVYMDTRYVYYRQLEYLHVSISSGLKCFSHVNTLPLLIWFWKSLSMTLVFVSSFSHSSHHFLYSAFHGEGSLKIPIPFSSKARTATKHWTVVTRQSIFNTTNSENDSSRKNYIAKL